MAAGGGAVDEEEFRGVLMGAQDGQRPAVASLYRSYNPMLVRFLGARARGMAEDLAHETWLVAAAGLPDFRGHERAFRIWLLSLARAQVVPPKNSSGRPDTILIDPDQLDTMLGTRQPEDIRVTDAAIAQLLDGLPSIDREVLLLRVVGELSAEEAGAVLGKSAGAVRVIQHRALRKVARRLSDHRVTR
jgi:RNA polymerase sigma-70 factor (ECF subfamily)